MVARKKGLVFRITGLPASKPDDELKESLKTSISSNLAENELLNLQFDPAIVPSCYDNEEKIALVEFHGGVPAFLSDLIANPQGEWQVEMGSTDISFDQHFFGFTQLYEPRADLPVTADIIAITGLDRHAYRSWRGKGNLGRMWLRDFLCKDMPCCRTMTYGYNSKLATHGVDTIMDYGRGLMEELKKIRNTEELRKRPLFFIAHGFGGIILAHCLIKAVQTDEDDHPTVASLYRATYGMLMFGIPHKGLVVDDIQKIVAGENNYPRSTLLAQIRSKSDLLAFQLADFINLIRDRKVDSKSKRWKRTGEFITAVDADSALLQLPDSMEDKIPLNTDHILMVKFNSRSDQGYRSARDRLKLFEQDATNVVAARFLRPQSILNTAIMIPFQRDNAFVGREDILVKISKKFQQEAPHTHSRVALVGLGGVGKSQIAIEYAYRLRDVAPQTWVFWVYAGNAARFKQAYTDIAAKIELPGRDDPKADILRLVYNWLCDERNGRWLIILDNTDDDRVFHSTSTDLSNAARETEAVREAAQLAPLASFLPQSSNGWILVTSRDRVAAVNLVETRNLFQVDPMAEDEALMLLKTRISIDKAFENDAQTLIRILGYIPLAITHAGAYIAVRAQTCTVSTYLDLFRESEENQTHLLSRSESQELRDMRRDSSVSSAVITTWHALFEKIRTMYPEAADLLSLMAMFDRERIPESILLGSMSRVQFEDAVAPLSSFSLIKTQLGQQTEERLFEMHGLVQLATKKWLEVQMQVDNWQKASLRIMAAALQSGHHETLAASRVLLPHARKVLNYALEERESIRNRAIIADKIVWYHFFTGEYEAAGKIGRVALVSWTGVLGVEHPDTPTSFSELGLVLYRQGKYEEAKRVHRRALEGYKKVLGVEHPDTLTNISQLGSSYLFMWQKALEGGGKNGITIVEDVEKTAVARLQVVEKWTFRWAEEDIIKAEACGDMKEKREAELRLKNARID
ncbi:hypothetical protein V494_06986 [Pseudogymnoascus sp. VKM F-4513 (FW-928)]|nr:hypothetical protein V494_06986 [Pseudogymnoascus sp. VKM F-4513 (FW-928)]